MNAPTALYRLYDSDETLLYIGISSDLRYRYKQHAKLKPWWSQVVVRDAEWFTTRSEAALAERDAIRREKPRHNAHHNQGPKTGGKSPERVIRGKVCYKAYKIYAATVSDMQRQGYSWGEAAAEGRRREKLYKLASGLEFSELRSVRNSEEDVLRAREMTMPRDARRLLDEVDSYLRGAIAAASE